VILRDCGFELLTTPNDVKDECLRFRAISNKKKGLFEYRQYDTTEVSTRMTCSRLVQNSHLNI
jgi:hypothetical protein